MNRHLTAATVVVATLAAVPMTATAAPHAAAVACGSLPRTRVYAIEATVVRCPEARRMAKTHERSVARNGACRPTSTHCVIGRFHCVYPFGPRPPLRVTCAWRGDYKVTFAYRAKKG
ncbi:hypothetical protein VSS74_26730 [Conexibacter stalactiti]|uniref:Secreted protein n=1 Tax=Conexibacter stalactiti TaxID=1940611 RepID=A0ABU4I0Z1_9ACTN|nr:hypothetical protein [Conexibacter stalactiti]MDW5597979.1 hypothetical protein [Conexibacter stalactiti]MEC5038621.1 hypothetical protein [Conexibacter stalactiti]